MITTPERSALMKRVRQKGTALEMRVAAMLRALGAHFRLNVKTLPGSPDIANKQRRKAIFVNGCYWHFHTVCGRGQIPASNREFWSRKFHDNRRRDQRKIEKLRDLDFDVLIVWECEFADPDLLEEKLKHFWFSSRNGKVPAGSPTGDQIELLRRDQTDEVARIEEFRLDVDAVEIVRTVCRRDGRMVESRVRLDELVTTDDLSAAYDRAWLRGPKPAKLKGRRRKISLVDLFSGCGGMTVGVAEACRALGLRIEPVLAVDLDETAREVYSCNFPEAELSKSPIEKLLPGDPGDELHDVEVELRARLGHIDVVVGGPPCQGHSDLNNHTRRSDPKNALFLKMARFAEVAEPEHIIIENVNGVLHDKGGVFERTKAHLELLGYAVDHGTLDAVRFGVPQRRRRVFMVASRRRTPELSRLEGMFGTRPRDVDWAIRDLLFAPYRGSFDEPSTPTAVNQSRIDYLFEQDEYDLPNRLRPKCHRDNEEHGYNAVYGRLYPDEPAPTITTGFKCMGQGRYVHPHRRRTLTPHEAARLQFFPDYFEFGELNRTSYGRLIGNAVPPKLVYVIALDLLR